MLYEPPNRYFQADQITEIIFRNYFSSLKTQTVYDKDFFQSINEVFICLVASALSHCLKARKTGVYVKPLRSEEFKYESSAGRFRACPTCRRECPTRRIRLLTHTGTYKRFLTTWDAHRPHVCQLLIKAIQTDLRKRIGQAFPRPDAEWEEALYVGNNSQFELELENEVRNGQPRKALPCQRMRQVTDDIYSHEEGIEYGPTAIVVHDTVDG